MSRSNVVAGFLCAIAIAGCSTESTTGAGNPVGPYITYALANGSMYRVEAKEGAVAQNVSVALNGIGAGIDGWINASPNGEWIAMSTERFDTQCNGYQCLVLVNRELTAAEVIKVNGDAIHPNGFGVVASNGNLIVYEGVGAGGTHQSDLWVVTRGTNTWNAPVVITGGSPYDYNALPAISSDGSKVLFDCGDVGYAGPGTAICEVGVTGTGLRVVITPADTPAGATAGTALHHADYAPDGSVVFEADWGAEQVWRLPGAGGTPTRVQPNSTNDNSPCVMSDGRVVSLWLSRQGNPAGLHEIKVMPADGSSYIMALINADVLDGGIGCAG